MLVHAVDDELAAAKPWDEAAQASLKAWLDQTIGQKVNLHEALEWASKHPTAQIGAIEVRPLYDDQPPARLPEPAPGKRRYLMLVCADPSVEREELEPIAPVEPWVNEMVGRGARRYGSQLAEPARAQITGPLQKRLGKVSMGGGPVPVASAKPSIGAARRVPVLVNGMPHNGYSVSQGREGPQRSCAARRERACFAGGRRVTSPGPSWRPHWSQVSCGVSRPPHPVCSATCGGPLGAG
jgi:hypothetical protein